jgi:hypothetical protein
MKYGSPIAGQQEACASTARKDKNTEWQAAEGVSLLVSTVNPFNKGWSFVSISQPSSSSEPDDN